MTHWPHPVIIARLIAAMMRWQPPESESTICLRCAVSPFSKAWALDGMPHDVVHDFVITLDLAVVERFDELLDAAEAEREAAQEPDDDDVIEAWTSILNLSVHEVWEFVVRHSPAIVEAKRRYLDPVVNEYVRRTIADGDLD